MHIYIYEYIHTITSSYFADTHPHLFYGPVTRYCRHGIPGLSESAKAADFLGIPSIPGPFEMKPQDAVVIGALFVAIHVVSVVNFLLGN